jgi:hypothetical protein
MKLRRSALRPPTLSRRPGVYLGVAAAGAVVVNVLVGVGPPAQAEGGGRSVSVARELGLTAQAGGVNTPADLRPLEDLAASRAGRAAAQSSAQQAQAAADQAALDRQKAEAEAAAAAAQAAAAQAATATGATATAVTKIAHITNSAGPVKPQTQAAADQVVSDVPGADAITLGGTRSSATDPDGHPSGLALDYMVLSDIALGQAIVQYHIDHWAELGVEYIIYRQRILYSPDGAWQPMANRGSPTANHMDHVHVNYLR